MSEATERPWRVFKNRDGTKLVGVGAQDGEGILDAGFGVWAWNDPEGIANAELVVHAVNNIDRITAERNAVKIALEQIRRATVNVKLGYEDRLNEVFITAKAALATLSVSDAER